MSSRSFISHITRYELHRRGLFRSDRPTLLSLNRFEKKKNAALAIDAFALLSKKLDAQAQFADMRLVLAGTSIFTQFRFDF